MSRVNRREFIKQAASCGAALALGGPASARSKVNWRERRDLFPEGVASGDPEPDSVLLWTRRPFGKGEPAGDTFDCSIRGDKIVQSPVSYI